MRGLLTRSLQPVAGREVGEELVRDFFDRVAVPGRDADDDRAVALDLALAAQAAVHLESRGLLNAVVFGFGGLGDLIHALFDIHMAGGAGADGAAGVLDVDAGLDGDLEEVLALGGGDIPLGFVGAGEPLGVFEEELDGDGLGAVIVIGVAEVQGVVLWSLGGHWAGGSGDLDVLRRARSRGLLDPRRREAVNRDPESGSGIRDRDWGLGNGRAALRTS